MKEIVTLERSKTMVNGYTTVTVTTIIRTTSMSIIALKAHRTAPPSSCILFEHYFHGLHFNNLLSSTFRFCFAQSSRYIYYQDVRLLLEVHFHHYGQDEKYVPITLIIIITTIATI